MTGVVNGECIFMKQCILKHRVAAIMSSFALPASRIPTTPLPLSLYQQQVLLLYISSCFFLFQTFFIPSHTNTNNFNISTASNSNPNPNKYVSTTPSKPKSSYTNTNTNTNTKLN